jgi:hypothetical protein
MTSHRRRPLCTLLRIPDRRGTQPRAPDNRDHRVSACGQLSEANMANVERRRSKHAYVPAPVTRSVDGTFYICCRINILVVRCAQLFRTNPSRERLRRVRRSAPCPSPSRASAARRACPVPRLRARRPSGQTTRHLETVLGWASLETLSRPDTPHYRAGRLHHLLPNHAIPQHCPAAHSIGRSKTSTMSWP